MQESLSPPVCTQPCSSRASIGRILRPRMARITPTAVVGDSAFRPSFDQVEGAIDHWIDQAKLVA